jgi:hypothetical protein
MTTKLNKKHQALLNTLLENMTTVKVVFNAATDQNLSAKSYTYKVPKHWGVKVHDALVVESNGLQVVQVVGVDKQADIDPDADFAYKWAVQKVDRSGHEAQLKREQLFLEQLADVERIHRRVEVLDKATSALGVGTDAAKAFQAAVAGLTGEAVAEATAAAPEATTAS